MRRSAANRKKPTYSRNGHDLEALDNAAEFLKLSSPITYSYSFVRLWSVSPTMIVLESSEALLQSIGINPIVRVIWDMALA